MFPNIFNLPYFQNLYGGDQGGASTYTPSGQVYNGPFKNDTRTPFRTVAPVKEGGFQPAYNRGLNASSAQLYDHFRSDGRRAMDYGFRPAGATQSFEDFLNRGNPTPAPTPVIPGAGNDGGGPGAIPPPKFPTALGGGFPGLFSGGWQGIFNLNPEQLARISQGTTGELVR